MATGGLYTDIKNILEQAKANAVRAVNFAMVVAYWEIGRRIVEEEQQGEDRAVYGGAVLKELSKKLTSDFGKGFTVVNLENFRKFYQVFTANPISYAVRRKLENTEDLSISEKSDALRRKSGDEDSGSKTNSPSDEPTDFSIRDELRHELKNENSGSKTAPSHSYFTTDEKSSALRRKLEDENSASPILYALRRELSWTHYRLLMRVENEEARTYYMNEAAGQNWSTRTLERQINSLYFERLLSSKNKKALIQQAEKEAAQDKPSVLDFVKDPYVLEFLQLQPNATLYEKELETELLNKLQLFLLELGKGFSFVARQQRISADDEHFFIDLVFYNYILKCFVLVDLKVGKLTHQDIGQMDLYVRYYEDQVKQTSDNPTIGLILCTEKKETIVKYSVLNESKHLFASKYKLYLPTEKELIAELNAELEQLKNKKLK